MNKESYMFQNIYQFWTYFRKKNKKCVALKLFHRILSLLSWWDRRRPAGRMTAKVQTLDSGRSGLNSLRYSIASKKFDQSEMALVIAWIWLVDF